MADSTKKYVFFAVFVVLGVVADQWTKLYAVDRLANRGVGHTLELTVEDESAGEKLEAFLAESFPANEDEEIEKIATKWTVGPEGGRVAPDRQIEAGETYEVLYRRVTVIPGFWDWEYAENRGAAFSLLAGRDGPFRLPLLIGSSLIAFALIIWLLREADWQSKVVVVALSLIGTGAIGNLIDRVRLGYVIDFVLWKWGEQYRWPNFNVADACITVGVAIVIVAILRGDFLAEPVDEEADD